MKQIEYIEEKKTIKNISINKLDSEQINNNSYFPIASITKIFTIFIILILQQKNKLNINDKVNKYINHNKNDFSTITILDLMNHISGIKNMYECKYDIIKSFSASSLTNMVINENLFKFKKNNFNYSNIGYVLLGYIIEKITKMKYWDVYNKYIFKPLKMKTYIGKPNIIIYNKKQQKISEKDFYNIYIASTAGAYISSINDLIKFSKNSIKLLNYKSRNILKKLYIYKRGSIIHKGSIIGGKSKIKIKYNNWKPVKIYIKLSTNN